MGKKKITEKDPTFLSRLVETYTHTGDQRETAKIMGVTPKTVRKYLHQEGIWPKRGRPRGRYYPNAYTGAFVQWLKDHPGITLPESPSEIAQLSGCTVDEIKTHLYRLRQAISREIETLPDLRLLDLIMEDSTGAVLPFRAMESYEIKIRKYSRKIQIVATLKGGRKALFNTHLDYLWEVLPKRRGK